MWLRHRVWFTIVTTGPTLWGLYLEYLLEAGPLSGLSHFALVYDLRLVVPLFGTLSGPFWGSLEGEGADLFRAGRVNSQFLRATFSLGYSFEAGPLNKLPI